MQGKRMRISERRTYLLRTFISERAVEAEVMGEEETRWAGKSL